VELPGLELERKGRGEELGLGGDARRQPVQPVYSQKKNCRHPRWWCIVIALHHDGARRGGGGARRGAVAVRGRRGGADDPFIIIYKELILIKLHKLCHFYYMRFNSFS